MRQYAKDYDCTVEGHDIDGDECGACGELASEIVDEQHATIAHLRAEVARLSTLLEGARKDNAELCGRVEELAAAHAHLDGWEECCREAEQEDGTMRTLPLVERIEILDDCDCWTCRALRERCGACAEFANCGTVHCAHTCALAPTEPAPKGDTP